MKIGILAYRQYPYISANTSIAYTLGEYISRNTSDEVVYIGRLQDETQKVIKDFDGTPICFFNEKPKDVPGRLTNYIRKVFGNRFGYSEEIKSLKKIVKEQKIDALICVIAPIDDLYIASEAKLSIPVAVYQLDPFYNINDTVNQRLKKEFIKLISKDNICGLFTTDLLYNEYSRDEAFSDILEKVQVLQFPKLKKSKASGINKTENRKSTLLYAGSLYRGIRNPDILVSLSEALPENAQIVFCGGCDCPEDFEAIKKSKVVCKGYLSQDELAKEYEKADVLVNIGNLVKNQLGSKIIDYISTGKPILNISQIENCPTLSVLENYRLKLNLKSEELKEVSVKESIGEFVERSKDEVIPFEEIEVLYSDYTPQNVCNRILEKIQTNNQM